MTATAHSLVAGAIASRFPDPVTAGLLAFVSHYIMDSIPHWDIGTNWRGRSKITTGILALVDTAVALTLAYFLFSQNAPLLTLAVAVVASLLPDWIETPWYIFFARANQRQPAKKAGWIEKLAFALYKTPNLFHSKTELPLGILTQVATVLFFLILLR